MVLAWVPLVVFTALIFGSELPTLPDPPYGCPAVRVFSDVPMCNRTFEIGSHDLANEYHWVNGSTIVHYEDETYICHDISLRITGPDILICIFSDTYCPTLEVYDHDQCSGIYRQIKKNLWISGNKLIEYSNRIGAMEFECFIASEFVGEVTSYVCHNKYIEQPPLRRRSNFVTLPSSPEELMVLDIITDFEIISLGDGITKGRLFDMQYVSSNLVSIVWIITQNPWPSVLGEFVRPFFQLGGNQQKYGWVKTVSDIWPEYMRVMIARSSKCDAYSNENLSVLLLSTQPGRPLIMKTDEIEIRVEDLLNEHILINYESNHIYQYIHQQSMVPKVFSTVSRCQSDAFSVRVTLRRATSATLIYLFAFQDDGPIYSKYGNYSAEAIVCDLSFLLYFSQPAAHHLELFDTNDFYGGEIQMRHGSSTQKFDTPHLKPPHVIAQKLAKLTGEEVITKISYIGTDFFVVNLQNKDCGRVPSVSYEDSVNYLVISEGQYIVDSHEDCQLIYESSSHVSAILTYDDSRSSIDRHLYNSVNPNFNVTFTVEGHIWTSEIGILEANSVCPEDGSKIYKSNDTNVIVGTIWRAMPPTYFLCLPTARKIIKFVAFFDVQFQIQAEINSLMECARLIKNHYPSATGASFSDERECFVYYGDLQYEDTPSTDNVSCIFTCTALKGRGSMPTRYKSRRSKKLEYTYSSFEECKNHIHKSYPKVMGVSYDTSTNKCYVEKTMGRIDMTLNNYISCYMALPVNYMLGPKVKTEDKNSRTSTATILTTSSTTFITPLYENEGMDRSVILGIIVAVIASILFVAIVVICAIRYKSHEEENSEIDLMRSNQEEKKDVFENSVYKLSKAPMLKKLQSTRLDTQENPTNEAVLTRSYSHYHPTYSQQELGGHMYDMSGYGRRRHDLEMYNQQWRNFPVAHSKHYDGSRRAHVKYNPNFHKYHIQY